MVKEDILIFLGAGASKGIGLPDTSKLFDIFEKEYKNKLDRECLALFNDIIEFLKSEGMSIDIEQVYTILAHHPKGLDSFVEKAFYPSRYLAWRNGLLLGSGTANISNLIKQDQQNKKATDEKLIRIIENFLVEIFWSELEKDKIEGYNSFFHILEKENGLNNCIFVTTNFDQVIEWFFHRIINKEINSGFKKIGPINIFDFSTLENDTKPKLIKLHGSVNWVRTEKNNIYYSIHKDIIPRTYINGERIKEFVLEYPIEGKNQYDEHGQKMMEIFTKELDKVRKIIIIGCSFRDPFITKLLVDSAKDKKEFLYISGGKPTNFELSEFSSCFDVDNKDIFHSSIYIDTALFPEPPVLKSIINFIKGMDNKYEWKKIIKI